MAHAIRSRDVMSRNQLGHMKTNMGPMQTFRA